MKSRVNKRAQFFGIYLVMLTLLMCGTVIMVYRQQQGNVASELISPKVVLDIADALVLFESREVALIEKSFSDSGLDKTKFREKFLSGIEADGEMKEFVFDHLVRDERDVVEVPGFFANVLYADDLTFVVGDKLHFARTGMKKREIFNPTDKSKNYFPIDFSFEFDRSYVVSEVNGKIKVVAV